MLCVPVRFLSQACSPFFHSVFYLSFQAALALNCGTRNLESVAPSFVTQALQSRLSSCSMQALLPMWHLCSPVRDRTCCSCTRRQILNPWVPGKPPPPSRGLLFDNYVPMRLCPISENTLCSTSCVSSRLIHISTCCIRVSVSTTQLRPSLARPPKAS